MIERRKYPRLNVDVDVEYAILTTLSPEDKDSQSTTQTKNISAGGICIIVYEDLPVGSLLHLKIFLPDSFEAIEAKGKIVWKSEMFMSSDLRSRYEVGVEFVEINEEDRDRIYKYVLKFV